MLSAQPPWQWQSRLSPFDCRPSVCNSRFSRSQPVSFTQTFLTGRHPVQLKGALGAVGTAVGTSRNGSQTCWVAVGIVT